MQTALTQKSLVSGVAVSTKARIPSARRAAVVVRASADEVRLELFISYFCFNDIEDSGIEFAFDGISGPFCCLDILVGGG